MSLNAAANESRQTTRFAGFLAGALVLHALFLMLPAQRGLQPGEVLHRLSVSLQSAAPPPPEPYIEPAQAQPKRPAAAARSDDTPAAVRTPKPPPAAAPPEPPGDIPAQSLSTARLLDFAQRRRWSFPEANEPRRLGAPAPETLRRGREARLPPGQAPEAALGGEIMDRWLAADGSQNVLIRTPSGRVLCGQTEAWDPMRPLVEQVRKLRDCGSGEPTFEWPELYRAGAPQHP